MGLHRVEFHAMAAPNEVQIHSADEGAARRSALRAIDEVLRIEAKYSRYRSDSVVSRINAAAGGEPIEVDPETEALLAFADACHRQSGGLFDPTSGILRRAWRFDSGRVPTAGELAPLLERIGWEKVEWGDGTVRLSLAGMELDFGGFGKEYAVDRAAAVLGEMGEASALVNLGGDLAILGPQPDGSPWRVGIREPRVPRALMAALPVASGAIATSGDYERFMDVDGVRHCHILDPRTGRSARGFRSVTVHAPSCLIAGGAATIAMLKGPAAGLQWLRDLELPYLCMLEDGTVENAFRGEECATAPG